MGKKIALSIAGSDPLGGAGIQADLKSFSFLGIHGTTAITCVTSQNTQQVKKIQRLPVEIIENQIDALYEDININAVKTGMLYDRKIVKCIAKKIYQYNMKPVIDPVMVATSGDVLSQNNFINTFKKELLPKTYVLTANIPEACKLLGKNIKSIDEVKKACREIFEMGPKYILIKGGHLNTKDAVDVLYDGKKIREFSLPRISNKKAHGSGCSLSAVITGLLALGETPIGAVRKAKYIVWSMINEGYKVGKGADVLNHSCKIVMPSTLSNNEYFKVWFELKNSIEDIVSKLPHNLVPEVGMNFVYALENAKNIEDICAINGRIFKTKNQVKLCGDINFGASKHVASIVLAAKSFDKNVRSAVNICYSKDNVEICKKVGFSIGFFDRKNEPAKAKSTMEWGTKQAIATLGFVPDVVYDTGGVGKEPMIRILGKNPKDVLTKIYKIIK